MNGIPNMRLSIFLADNTPCPRPAQLLTARPNPEKADFTGPIRRVISSAHSLGEPHFSSPYYAIGRMTAFAKSATGKTDVSSEMKLAYVAFTMQ
jgi:hypothetical protein